MNIRLSRAGVLAVFALALPMAAQAASPRLTNARQPQSEMSRWRAQAKRVTIVRDDWGIAHIHGHLDSDAVFGMIYAQAEDDFGRVEANYLTALGRTAEAVDAKPEAIWVDLRQRLYVDADDLKARYASSPDFLKAVMDGWADGLNYYLATHPAIHPKVLTHFEPWMALSFTEGSIGGDVERIDLKALQAFYEPASPGSAALLSCAAGEGDREAVDGAKWAKVCEGAPFVAGLKERRATFPAAQEGRELAKELRYREPTGSNGIAIAPNNTRDGHALLLINPHTSFYFRSELQMSSDEGLDVYGAVTWGQPFVYQGFNEHVGFMHTSSGVDAVDEFTETVSTKAPSNPGPYLACTRLASLGMTCKPMQVVPITLHYRASDGRLATRIFTTYRTDHGPIVRQDGDTWIAFSMMYRPVPALTQSWLRTKAKSFATFAAVADQFKANSSNNTLFADDQGTIAYLHPQFIPRRDDRFDYTRPVDGSDPATAWKGDTAFENTPHLVNPPSGFVYNTNDQPWNAAGEGSLNKAAFPKYMDQAGWNPRGPHALRVLTGRHDFTLESLNRAAFDSYQPEFAILLPKLLADYDALPVADPLKAKLADPVAALRNWDFTWGLDSIPTSVAVFYGEQLFALSAPAARTARIPVYEWMDQRITPAERLRALASATEKLTADFGRWKMPWGQINRYQRLDDSIDPHFDDAKPSSPVPFTSAQWGSLASFGARAYPNTKKYYGTGGNSFVAVVEFGSKVRALAVTAGGESGDPSSFHFQDQAGRYASGNLREVYFYPDQLKGHTERTYHPGEGTPFP